MALGTLNPTDPNGTITPTMGVFHHYDENGNPVDASGNPSAPPGPARTAPPGPGNTTPPSQQPGGGQLTQGGVLLPSAPIPPWLQPNASTSGTSGSPSPFDTSGSNPNSPFNPWSGTFTAPTPNPLPPSPTGTFTPPTSGFQPTPTPAAPTFTAPTYRPPPAFVGPTAQEALNDPGYQFRLSQGANALQGWAAARGTLNDSSTAKALTDYGQNSASQEYQTAWQRAVDLYKTNYQSQYTDPYTFAYQGAKDSFAPQMAGFSANVNAASNANAAANSFNLASNAAGANAANLGYTTQASNIQHQNDTSNANAWNNYYLSWQDLQNRRTNATNFALVQ